MYFDNKKVIISETFIFFTNGLVDFKSLLIYEQKHLDPHSHKIMPFINKTTFNLENRQTT